MFFISNSTGLLIYRKATDFCISTLYPVAVRLLNCVWLFETPWTVAQVSLRLSDKKSACNPGAANVALIPGLGRSPGEGNGYPHQYSWLVYSMDRGEPGGATVRRFSKSWTWPNRLSILKHTQTRLPYPSPSFRVCSNSCPLCQWCHPTISSSVVPFYSLALPTY